MSRSNAKPKPEVELIIDLALEVCGLPSLEEDASAESDTNVQEQVTDGRPPDDSIYRFTDSELLAFAGIVEDYPNALMTMWKFISTCGTAERLEGILTGADPRFVEYVGLPAIPRWFLTFWETSTTTPDRYLAIREILGDEGRLKEMSQLAIRIDEAVSRYEESRTWAKRLEKVVWRLATIGEEKMEVINSFLEQGIWVTNTRIINNKLKLDPDYFTNAFNGCPIDRIRKCSYCKRIYWVDRVQKHHGCSKDCLNKLRSKASYKNMSDEKKQERKRKRIEREIRREKLAKEGTIK